MWVQHTRPCSCTKKKGVVEFLFKSQQERLPITKASCLMLSCCSVPLTDPCPPENIWVEEPIAGNCSVVWEKVPLVEYYVAFIKRDDGTEKSCNTTKTTCQFFCMCGYTYLTSVFPYNQAGTSLFADVRNYTTSENVVYFSNEGSTYVHIH